MKDWRELLQNPLARLSALLTAAGVAVILYWPQVLWILLWLLLGALLGLAVMWFVRRMQDRRDAGRFGARLHQNASKAPTSVDDPAKRAEFDRLRDKFNQGLQRVVAEGRRKGMDYLYRHPWILIVGEPGSGKTEAIRHSGIVSPRMQDELQGAGGTLNMDWWFTERAVILDTAGRMVFEEEAAASSNEFNEFLRLLRKGRPLTPINGLLVTVSADTLVTGTDDEIHERSTKLGEKIAEVQSVLEVRFPVYVLVTKCDKITGFHEFFSRFSAEDTAAQQILGWTNPESLDTPFRAEDIENHLHGVIETLRLVRYRLLDRTNEPTSGSRRLDDMDALFVFPNSLRVLASKLRLYLEPVFAAGEWSVSSPPFVRGVYFSSAISTGAVLDKELATALGVPLEQLGYQSLFERKWALFLRDVFIEKILPERGLVTSNPRTEGIVWRRRITIWSTLAAVLVIGFLAIGLAYASYRDGINRELGIWKAKFTTHKDPERRQIVAAPLFVESALRENWVYVDPDAKSLNVDGEPTSPADYHVKLEAMTRQPLHVPWFFRPVAAFGSDFDQLRRQAQNAAFVSDVVRPLVDAARARIIADTEWTSEHTKILSTLIELENAASSASFLGSPETLARSFWQFGIRTRDPMPLEALFRRSYEPVAGGPPPWPPAQLAQGGTVAINEGVRKLAGSSAQAGAKNAAAIQLLSSLKNSLRKLKETEDQLVASGGAKASAAQQQYENHAEEVGALLRQCAAAGIFTGGVGLMQDAIAAMRSELDRQFDLSLKQFRDVSGAPDTKADPRSAILATISEQYGQQRDAGKKQIDEAFPESDRASTQELDERFLLRDAHGLPLYTARVELLKKVISAPARSEDGIETRLIGHLAEFDQLIVGSSTDKKVSGPEGADSRRPTVDSERFTSGVRNILIDLYDAELDKFFGDYVGFPLVRDRTNKPVRPDDLPKVRNYLRALGQDTPSLDAMLKVNRSSRASAVKRRVAECLKQLSPMVDGLLERNELTSVVVTYLAFAEQEDTVRKIRGARNLAFQLWRYVGSDLGETIWRADEEHEIGKFRVSSRDMLLYFYEQVDSSLPHGEPLRPLQDWELFVRMLDPNGEPRLLDGGKLWRVAYSRKDDKGNERYFAMSFRFPRELPAPDQWPTYAQLTKK